MNTISFQTLQDTYRQEKNLWKTEDSLEKVPKLNTMQYLSLCQIFGRRCPSSETVIYVIRILRQVP